MKCNSDESWDRPNRYFVQDDSDRPIHPASPLFPLRLWGNVLVYKTPRRCLRLRANPSQICEICLSTVLNYVGDARHDGHLKHRHSKNYADDGKITAVFQA